MGWKSGKCLCAGPGTSLECHSFFFFFFLSSFFSSSSSELLLLLLLSESESLLESLLLESEEDSSFLAFLADSFGSSVFLFITVVLLSRCTYFLAPVQSYVQCPT